MIKKILKWLLITFLVGILFIAGFVVYDQYTFVERNFKKYTGVRFDYIVKTNYHTNHSSYIEVIIHRSDKYMLRNKFKFENKFPSQIISFPESPEFLTENPNYVYYMIEAGEGPYGHYIPNGYILFALEKEGNTLIVYDWYGESLRDVTK